MPTRKCFAFEKMYKKLMKVMISKNYVKLSLNWKMKNSKKNIIFIEKQKDMLENLECEQIYYSRTLIGFYKIWHDSIRLKKWLAYYDGSYYENITYQDFMGSILNV